MKRLCMFLAIFFLAGWLFAQQVGKINHIVGDVRYRESPGASFTKTSANSPVSLNGEIQTALAASVEILWTNGNTSKIGAGKMISIRKLFEEEGKNLTWDESLLRKLSNLFSQKESEVSSVAGIRRNDRQTIHATELYWSSENGADMQSAYQFFDEENYEEAIPILEQVIEQGPLKKDAEISRAMLILIYHKLDNLEKMAEHQALLEQDFPTSSFLGNTDSD